MTFLWVRDRLRFENFKRQSARILGLERADTFSLLKGLKQWKENLHRAERQLKVYTALLEPLKEGVVLTNDAGEIIHLNPRAADLLGLSRRQRGLNLKEILREETLWQALAQKEAAVLEIELFWPFPRTLEVTMVPLSEGFVGFILQDVTPFRRLSDIRRDFVSYLAHEIRTPLTAIEGYAENLLDEVPEEQREELAVILRNARRLSRLVKDLQTLSRLELQGIPAEEFEEIDLREVVSAATDLMRPKFEEKNLKLSLDLQEARIRGHFDHLLRAVVNLLDNAVKFSPEGGTIEISLTPDQGTWVLSIRDQGPGISPSEKERVFERFYRGRRGDKQGTGLGLSIVKHIVLAHGGRVEVESEPGAGATFRLILPASNPDERRASL